MRAMIRPGAVLAALLALLAAEEPRFRVLVFSKTAGFRHESIPAGIEAIRALGAEHGFAVEATEDPAVFTDAGLRPYDAVVFLSTTGDVLDEEQQAAFERYVRRGNGYAGIHAAADTEHDWPWYGRLVGAYFTGHGPVRDAVVVVPDRAHPATRPVPERWERSDEWYEFDSNPRGRVHVLASLDVPGDRPMAWCHDFDGGRSFYTAGGHTTESFAEEHFRAHLLGGIAWAAGAEPGDAGATVTACWDKTVLDDHVTDPMELAVAPDGRVVFVERGGAVKIWRPEEGTSAVAGFVDVFAGLEDGLLGLALDPGFEENGWFYVFYSPAGDPPVNRVSRFTMRGGAFAAESESIVLEFPTQRDECCHSGGSLAFDPSGNLYVATGDNTSPFASDGYAPIDERPGRSAFDAQKSSSSTSDLRGKILRIRPRPEGGFDVPAGNLFPADGSLGRPEIYVMGCRNPFRISVDPKNGLLYWGDVGPDAAAPCAGRGPAGADEFNRAGGPGNYGWPYFIGDGGTYVDYDFATGESGAPFDPESPKNDSPNSTGLRSLPAARPALFWYEYGPSEAFPEFGEGGRCAMAGPVYRRTLVTPGPRALPPYCDGALFLYDWARGWIVEARFDKYSIPLDLARFLPGLPLTRPMDLELGPDGCLYLIEWGSGFAGGNPDSQISRLEYYAGGERPPAARASASRTSGAVPLAVSFSSAGSAARSGPAALRFAWDFDGDGAPDSTEPDPDHVYAAPGAWRARLVVTDGGGRTSTASVPVWAGNTRPAVAFEWPPAGGVAGLGETVEFRVRATDAEDGPADPARVAVQPFLGHDTHAHPLHPRSGTSGTITTLADAGHAPEADLFTVICATFTDAGAAGVAPLTGRAEIVLQPRRKQAEHARARGGARIEKSDDPSGGGQEVVLAAAGDWTAYGPVDLHGIDGARLRAAGPAGAVIELRLDAPGGPLLASAALGPGPGWQDVDVTISDPGGAHDLYAVARGAEPAAPVKLNWIEFRGPGVTRRSDHATP
jgi:glucose/arabinose dehydrogenase